ncbi:LysR family transcriptional regulator [Streptomyces sp. LHD-70]|uniref:LysR family transcriptional regulator n=1 Tax=Streptomyces sp. LHD-70 TaxID=3072140 RepID=UPI00280FAF4C|nr:LysR family transcriptional regulator [Streptomyces sp. LHD-70]MDQ8702446.1 LysR family transcriptional regulator [Streptomyces sp. LHD-70]
MDIGLRHLRCFLTLAEEQHFTWAADRLGISQPTLSRHVQRLEGVLGRDLVDRSTRHPRLTAEGRRLQAELQVLLPQLETALRPTEPRASLRLGYAWGFPVQRGRQALATLEERHLVLVQTVRRDDRTAGLRGGEVDAALLWDAAPDPRLVTTEILREPRIAAVSRSSTLAVRERVSWRDLGRRCLVVNTVSGTLTPQDWPADAAPEIGAETSNIEEYLHAVAARRGVGVLPVSVAAQHPDPDILYLPLDGAPPAVLTYAYPRSDPHAYAATLGEVLRQDRPGARAALAMDPKPTQDPDPAKASARSKVLQRS